MGGMLLGEIIDSWRKEKKLTGRQLAKQIGVANSTLYRFMSGHNIRFEEAAPIIRWTLQHDEWRECDPK